ncbi:DNA-directed RNA polymerase subunit beta', partial [Patescibacteria group bacterium]|nr:DNA-directed RNA polymerase subunit beta' [Patescibacteria group bacterium]
MHTKRETSDVNDFTAVSIKLADPEVIRSWSYGEVTKPETINYRTQRSEKNGLFDEKIFGPTRDYECFCGKYKGIRYKGIVCDRCGVEVTRSIVRRERMGHIELSTPVAHIWFLRAIPSRIATVMGLSAADVEKVVYFAGYIITGINDDERARLLREIDTEYKTKHKAAATEAEKTKLKELFTTAKQEIEKLSVGQVLDEATYHRYSIRYGTLFEARIGAEAIYDLFTQMDLSALREQLTARREKAGALERAKLNKRIALINSLINSGARPEWMFLTTLPVTPPALRPMVALEGGRHASSDVNDLYRRVINRNNRLRKLIDIHAPEVILRNEKRILQEAVDALIDNSIRHGNAMYSAMSQSQRRPLKSLSDYLKGKQGYFRQNLLGKRVDYSGRSVIVVGPELALDQCGLPKHMALELFRPFVISKLLERELAFNIRGAGRLIEDGIPEVWAILEEVIADKYVLLNRAPTLHRQGIQAFRPVLIEGNAIRVHPLVCPAFNADFDGDQMAVHVPLSKEAQLEARDIMSATKNILKPGSGTPTTAANQDIILGAFWMTKIVAGERGEGKYFASPNDAINAYDHGLVSFRAKILVLPSDSDKYAPFDGKPFETSVGRLLFNSVLPKDYPFLNQEMKKGGLSSVVADLIRSYGLEAVPPILDKIKNFGFTYATRSGVTWSIDELSVPAEKEEIVREARERQLEITDQYNNGLLSAEERKRMVIEVWHHAKSEIEQIIPTTIDENGSVYDLVISGARV